MFALHVRLRRKRQVLKKRIGKQRNKKSKLEKFDKAVEHDEAKIQNNIGVGGQMMACASQELLKATPPHFAKSCLREICSLKKSWARTKVANITISGNMIGEDGVLDNSPKRSAEQFIEGKLF